LLVKLLIEQDELANDFVAAKRLQLIEIVDDYHVSGYAFVSSRRAPTESGYDNPLLYSGRKAGACYEFRSFGTAYPMPNFDFFEMDFQPQTAHLGCNVFNRCPSTG
jgi:hypothetical protein